jgi:hypothetical protein
MNTSTFAVALKTISKKGIDDRILFYDESNINKRSSSSRVNRDMIDLYMAIRGLNIFHMWCNPSLDMIDKHFIQERIKAIILCPSKTKGARVYFYFKQSAILEILKRYDTLTIETLKRVRRKYCLYRGWFKEYKGILKQPYLKIKGNRMVEKVEIFHDKYAEVSDKEYYSLLDIAKQMGCHYTTAQKYVNLGIEQQLLKENEQYKKNFNGSLAFTKDSIEIIKSMASKTYLNWTSNMGKHLRKPQHETAA